jgi:hypothetical protein
MTVDAGVIVTAGPGQNPDVAWAIGDVKSRAPQVQECIDYYEGRHRVVAIPDGATTNPLLADLIRRLRDNMCDDVVDEPVSRLELVAWRDRATDDDDTTDGTDQVNDTGGRAEAASALWADNRGPARERRTYTDMARAGDAYNIVEQGADGRVRWQPQDPRQMAVAYLEDRPDTLRVAAKVWQSGKRWRLNLYYTPGFERTQGVLLERYATKGVSPGGGIPEPRAFLPYTPEPDPITGEVDQGVREWTRNPVFHFPADEVGGYGRSVLTELIPLQDTLNKAMADWVVNMEDTALPARWAVGVQKRIDPVTGAELPISRRPRRATDMLTVSAGDGTTQPQFGQFDAADMDPFVAAVQAHRVEIARKGYLPPSSVILGDTAGAVSGLSLLVQEGRQVKRCTTWQRDAGWVWREQMAYMLTLAGLDTAPDDLVVEWAPAQTRDEQALWELLTLKQALGVPTKVLLVEGGYDSAEVDRWVEDAAASQGGRVSAPGVMPVGGVASVTIPGMPGGLPVAGGLGIPSAPAAPAGAVAPGLANG